MPYCGEVSEDDWCSSHACMNSRCRWQHEETFEQMRARVQKAREDIARGWAREAEEGH